MKNNKPRYHVFSNTLFALEGLIDIVKNETSFRIELVLFILLQASIFFLPVSYYQSVLLSMILFVPLIVEAINSAIERVVDLVTKDYHELAKHAKDAGSAAVFLSLCLVVLVWFFVLYDAFGFTA
ncbi:MAG: diacylglycerol kinase [Thiomicrospira sp.]|nr:MAG: diacylglycerol kinase [Thiomicrospira sp.]